MLKTVTFYVDVGHHTKLHTLTPKSYLVTFKLTQLQAKHERNSVLLVYNNALDTADKTNETAMQLILKKRCNVLYQIHVYFIFNILLQYLHDPQSCILLSGTKRAV